VGLLWSQEHSSLPREYACPRPFVLDFRAGLLKAPKPRLCSVSNEKVETFRRQVKVADMIG
jgi:hypothetical protein